MGGVSEARDRCVRAIHPRNNSVAIEGKHSRCGPAPPFTQ